MALDLWHIVPVFVGMGFLCDLIRQYRGFKHRRRARPYVERNAGFWTDRKIIRVEAVFCCLWVAVPWSGIILFVALDRPIWVLYLCLLTYALAVWVAMAGLNAKTDKDGHFNFSAEEAADQQPPSGRQIDPAS